MISNKQNAYECISSNKEKLSMVTVARRNALCVCTVQNTLSIYTGGGVPRHIQKGGSYARAQPKKGGS